MKVAVGWTTVTMLEVSGSGGEGGGEGGGGRGGGEIIVLLSWGLGCDVNGGAGGGGGEGGGGSGLEGRALLQQQQW